jgi:hypothetical protein
MHSLRRSSSENESNTPERSKENQTNVFYWAAGIGYVIFITRSMWQNDEFALTFLHLSTKILQRTARLIGHWAIHTENSYNEIVETLH